MILRKRHGLGNLDGGGRFMESTAYQELSAADMWRTEFEELFGLTGLTRAKLAQVFDLDVGTVHDWANGRRRTTGPARAYMRLFAQVRSLVDPHEMI